MKRPGKRPTLLAWPAPRAALQWTPRSCGAAACVATGVDRNRNEGGRVRLEARQAMEPELASRRCAATKNSGEPCTVDPQLLIEDEETPGIYWCFGHSPWLEEEREAARERGGLRTALKNRNWKNRYLDA